MAIKEMLRNMWHSHNGNKQLAKAYDTNVWNNVDDEIERSYSAVEWAEILSMASDKAIGKSDQGFVYGMMKKFVATAANGPTNVTNVQASRLYNVITMEQSARERTLAKRYRRQHDEEL